MALKLRPFELPRSSIKTGGQRIAPLAPGESAFRIADTEQWLFSHIADEHIRIIGTDADYLVQKVSKTKKDPLYNEPRDAQWSRPYKIRLWVSWAPANPVLGEEGVHFVFASQGWLARLEVARAEMPIPQEGDILKFWSNPYFNDLASGSDPTVTPFSSHSYDIIRVNEDGHLADTPTFMGYKFDLRRRSAFGAERRVVPP